MADKVLVDTSALYALVATSDSFHSMAKPLYDSFIDRSVEVYLTSYIWVEASAIIHSRLGFSTLKKLIADIMPVTSVYWIEEATHQEAWNQLVARNGAGPSLVDWTTILVARNLGSIVFTFDKHFEAEGLSVLPRRL